MSAVGFSNSVHSSWSLDGPAKFYAISCKSECCLVVVEEKKKKVKKNMYCIYIIDMVVFLLGDKVAILSLPLVCEL